MSEQPSKPSRMGESLSKSSHPYTQILQLNQELVANLQGLVDEHEGRKGKGRRVRPGSRHSISRDERGENPCDISKEVLVACPHSDIRRRRCAMENDQ